VRLLRSKNGDKGMAKLLLDPPFAEPTSYYDSLNRDLLHRIIERQGAVTLDITDMIRPELDTRPAGVIRRAYGAWTGNHKLRDTGEPVPFDQIDRLEVTLWFEPGKEA
jgi:hypothetical protein